MLIDDGAAVVIAVVATAFADQPTVPRETWVYPGSWETDDLVENLAKVNDSPTERFLEWHSGSLPVFTPEGLRRVLPFYMRYSMLRPDSDVAEYLIFHLGPGDVTSAYWRERLEVFSDAQKQAICQYVRYMETALKGQHYDQYFLNARRVWGCE